MTKTSVLLVMAALMLLGPKQLSAASIAEAIKPNLTSIPAGGSVAILVTDLQSGQVLFERGADMPLRLASLAKLLVSSAALWDLGLDYRFHTRVVGVWNM